MRTRLEPDCEVETMNTRSLLFPVSHGLSVLLGGLSIGSGVGLLAVSVFLIVTAVGVSLDILKAGSGPRGETGWPAHVHEDVQ